MLRIYFRSPFSSRLIHTFQETLNLPITTFPMRAEASVREPQLNQICSEELYQWQKTTRRAPCTQFILHDGPPFANGDLHVGHLLNKVLKDVINRYKILCGFGIQFFPGWDCHGLPIEIKALESFKDKGLLTPIQIREAATVLAKNAIASQKKDFKRWGIMADWDNAYHTMDPAYEAAQISVFRAMAKRDLLFRALKPVYWSPSSRTALAEAELEYVDDHKSTSVYVAFKMTCTINLLKTIQTSMTKLNVSNDLSNIEAIIWTTTPWSIPSNMAIAFNPLLKYSLVECCDRTFFVAENLVDLVCKKISQNSNITFLATVSGNDLLGSTYEHPLYSRFGKFIEGKHVTDSSGTGLVHTAPAHGIEDYEAMKHSGQNEIILLVNDAGKFTAEAGDELINLDIFTKGTSKVIEILKRNNRILCVEDIKHRYPYDWRTKKPIIQRATKQWFCRLNSLQKSALNALENVKLVPESGRNLFTDMVDGRSEWCISRQRHWGLPIPVFYEKATGKEILCDEIMEHIQKLFESKGSSCWWDLPTEELLPASYRNNGIDYIRGSDTLDVWFDSGSSWCSAMKSRVGDSKIDMVVEGEDQYRGWFQSLLLTSVAVTGSAPYSTIVTHGFVLDEKSRKMSKSLGNVVVPSQIIDGKGLKSNETAYGADVLRLWAAFADYTSAVTIGPSILEKAFEIRNKMRNICRFLLGVLDDFGEANMVLYENLFPVDKYMLHLVNEITSEFLKDYSNLNFSKVLVGRDVTRFTHSDISSLYATITKDRLYADVSDGIARRSAQTVLFFVLNMLVRTLAPILCHTMEEVYQNMPNRIKELYKKYGAFHVNDLHLKSQLSHTGIESAFCYGFISYQQSWLMDSARLNKWAILLDVRELVLKQLALSRETKVIGSSVEASVTLLVSQSVLDSLNVACDSNISLNASLEELFVVSNVHVALKDPSLQHSIKEGLLVAAETIKIGKVNESLVIVTERVNSPKCARCWKLKPLVESKEICSRCDDFLN